MSKGVTPAFLLKKGRTLQEAGVGRIDAIRAIRSAANRPIAVTTSALFLLWLIETRLGYIPSI
jgi:hypothetical protein